MHTHTVKNVVVDHLQKAVAVAKRAKQVVSRRKAYIHSTRLKARETKKVRMPIHQPTERKDDRVDNHQDPHANGRFQLVRA